MTVAYIVVGRPGCGMQEFFRVIATQWTCDIDKVDVLWLKQYLYQEKVTGTYRPIVTRCHLDNLDSVRNKLIEAGFEVQVVKICSRLRHGVKQGVSKKKSGPPPYNIDGK